MCGIAGILHLDRERVVEERLLRRMNETLFHRGPDDEGYFVDGPVGLAMRRLSIIDLAGGHQPVFNEDKSISVVFNGEIYNYRELAQELRAKGHVFTTASDTETIVHLYEEHGSECVSRLRGMFAFALWDRNQRTLLLARDRLGVKPLYYGVHDGRVFFGSELKALLADPSVPRSIDSEGLAAYLRYGYIADPRTILREVRKLPPGHVLLVRDGRVELRQYWDVVPFFAARQPTRSTSQCEEEVEELLNEAVRLRLVSDVPVGAFLSGGIDSSMVVALMARALDHPVKTFSIGFELKAFNELPYAREVARHLGTEHHELILEPESVDIIKKIVWHFDEPFGDPSSLPTYFVSKLARESVKVVLSGDGGDELFAGYDRYSQHLRRAFADRIPDLVKRRALRPLSGLLPEGTAGKRLLHNLSLPAARRYLDSISYFSPQRQLLSPDVLRGLPSDVDADYLTYIQGLDFTEMLSGMQALDFKTYLPGDILAKVDRMSMAHSLEARVPLLDHQLVEYVVCASGGFPELQRIGKRLFKQIARAFLPAPIVDRKKHGFAVPLQSWFKEDLSSSLLDVLHDPTTRQRGYFDQKAIGDFLHGPLEPAKLWILALLELWHREILERPGYRP